MTSVGTIQTEIANLQGIISGLSSDNPAYVLYLTQLQGLQLELYQAQNSLPQPGLSVDDQLAQDDGGVPADGLTPAASSVGDPSQAQDASFDTQQGLS